MKSIMNEQRNIVRTVCRQGIASPSLELCWPKPSTAREVSIVSALVPPTGLVQSGPLLRESVSFCAWLKHMVMTDLAVSVAFFVLLFVWVCVLLKLHFWVSSVFFFFFWDSEWRWQISWLCSISLFLSGFVLCWGASKGNLAVSVAFLGYVCFFALWR